MKNTLIYLDTYLLQRDMRLRLPKSLIANLGAIKGITKFDIYLDTITKEIILKINDETRKTE